MNINLPFDYNNNIDDVNIILMNNSLDRIGNINCFYNFNCLLNYNSANEISFDVYKYVDDLQCKYWNLIYDLKNVFIEELSEVYKIYVSIDDTDYTVKHVVGRSLCEDELSNIKIYDIQINTASDILRDDYTTPTTFYNSNPKNSLLDRILEKAPHYTIEFVAASLKPLQYTFEFNDCSIYEALMEIGEKIGCIFKFNSLKRSIRVYDLKNYCIDCNKRYDEQTEECPYCHGSNIVKGDGNDTVITVSKDTIANMISLDNNEDSYINCLRIKTGDEMLDATIKNINPNGSEYIYYFNDDIINDMPTSLVKKINDYNKENEYYNKEYVLDFNDGELKEAYNSLVKKYNSDIYKNYQYDENNDKNLKNNSFIDIDTEIIGFEKIIGLYYDNIDFQLYLQSNLMPYVLQEDVDIEEDIKNLTVDNLSPIALSELSTHTSISTIEIYLKKYVALYLRNSYIIEIITSDYDFEGGREDGWNYGRWSGKIKLTEYGSEKKTLETPSLSLEINDNYQIFLNEKILTSLRNNDDSMGSIYNIMSIKDENEFKNALKLYSLNRLKSFEDAYQSGIDIMIEADQANESADFYQDIYVPLYNKLQFIKSETSIRENEVSMIERTQQRIEEIKANIQESLNFENYIGVDLWKIFCTYRREDTYTNDNITSEGLSNTEIIDLAKETIENAQDNIKVLGYLQKTITCSLNNFLAMKEFASYKEEFNLGNWIVSENDGLLFKQRLISINISMSNEITIDIELSQVTKKEDELNDIKSILNQASDLSASIGEIKNSIIQADKNNQVVSNWLENGLDLTNLKIISGAKNQNVVYDSNGILVRTYDDISQSFSSEQLKIINSTIAITRDDWKTIETAIGKIAYIDPKTKVAKYNYGVNAKILVGQLILGESLGIYSDDGNASMSFDNNGLVLNAKKGTNNQYNKILDIQIDGKSCFYISRDGELILDTSQINDKIDKTGVILAINQSTETLKIKAGKITLEGVVTANNNFKILDDGSMEAMNGKFSGKITATSGMIGRYNITSSYLETGSGSTTAGMGGNQAFYAGASASNEAPFRVSYDGSLYASNANITGTISGSTISGSTIIGGSITSGTNINVSTDLHVGNSIYIGTYTDRDTKKYVYFNDRFYIASRNDIISFGVNNGDVFSGKIYVSSSGNCTINGSSSVSVVSGSSGTLIHSDGTISINSSSAVSINGDKIDVSLTHGKYFSIYGGYNHSVQVFTETGQKRTILRPSANGGAYLGTTNARWNTAFFTNSITASDLKEKQIIDRDMKSRELIMSLKPISYKRIGNGDTGNRVHMGFGAQTVNTAIKTLGLSDLSIVQASIVDGENEIPYHGEDIDDNKLSWGLNYVEFIPPMVDVLQCHDKKIKYLQNENNHLKQELKNTQDKLNAFISGNYEIKTIYRKA